MIAYKISVNGTHIVTAGQEDWAILSAHITSSRVNPEEPGTLRYVKFRVGGITENAELASSDENASEHFRYPLIELNVGDSVTVEIVDVADVDSPEKRYIRTSTPEPDASSGPENAG